jgi:hypothetical protein
MMAHQAEDEEYWGPDVLDTARTVKRVKQKKYRKGSNSLLWGWEWVPGRWVKNYDDVEEGAQAREKGHYTRNPGQASTEKTALMRDYAVSGDGGRDHAKEFTVGQARNAPTETVAQSTTTTSATLGTKPTTAAPTVTSTSNAPVTTSTTLTSTTKAANTPVTHNFRNFSQVKARLPE